MADKYRRFQPILNFPQQLFAIYQHKINQQQQILALIRQVIPAELARHMLYCVEKGTKILVFTDSATWSSQLRFFNRAMLDALHEHGYEKTESIQIKILPQAGKAEKPSTAKVPSKETIELVSQQATLQQNSDLRNALTKLAATLRKRSAEKD